MSHVPAESPDAGADQAVATGKTSRYGWLRSRLGGRSLTGWPLGAFLASYGLGLLFVLGLHGFLPGMSQVPLTALMGQGAIQCLHDQGVESLWNWCMSLGLPVGAPRLTGLPQIYAGWILTFIPGVDSWAAHQWSNAAFVAVAFAASYSLLRRWATPRWVALLVTVSYLTALNLIPLNGFEYTFLGYLLLPAYVLVAVWVLDRIDAGRWVGAVLACLGLCLFMVFTEGYSFLGAGVVIGCLVLAWGWRTLRAGRWARALSTHVLWVLSVAGATLLYVVWTPDSAFETASGLETFGLFGVDLVSLVTPTASTLVPGIFDVPIPVLSLRLWGVGQSIDVNYVGYLCLLLAFGFLAHGLVGARRRGAPVHVEAPDAGLVGPIDTADDGDVGAVGAVLEGVGADDHVLAEALRAPGERRTTSELRAVAVAGVIALLLSLGPVLKTGQTVPGLAAAVLDLPTAWVYESVPGFTEMRAVHRWLVVTRWCLMMLTAGGLTQLWTRWRGVSPRRAVVVVLLGVLAVVEVAPDVPQEFAVRAKSVQRVEFLRDGILAEADELIVEGETILILPTGNDFLANYLVPMVGARSFNVGIDKNYALSTARWPEPVLATQAYGPDSADLLCAALNSDVDAIVLPYMSPYFGPLLHGASRIEDDERYRVAQVLARDRRFDAEVGSWLTVLRGAVPSCTR